MAKPRTNARSTRKAIATCGSRPRGQAVKVKVQKNDTGKFMYEIKRQRIGGILAVQCPLEEGKGIALWDARVHVSSLDRLPLAPHSVDMALSGEEAHK